jgi:hypothetical protein
MSSVVVSLPPSIEVERVRGPLSRPDRGTPLKSLAQTALEGYGSQGGHAWV